MRCNKEVELLRQVAREVLKKVLEGQEKDLHQSNRSRTK